MSDPDDVPEAGSPRSVQRSRAARIVFNRRVVRVVGILILLGILYYSLFVLLPSEVDWSQVWGEITALTGWELVALVGSGLLVIVALGWTSRASLPNLTLYQGTESSVTSQLSAFVFPPPADMLIRFAMYRTYGFTDEQSGAAVLVALVARYTMVVLMPLLGLVVVLLTGHGTWAGFFWLLGLGLAFSLVIWLIIRVATSVGAAHATGRWLQRVASKVIPWFHRTPPTDLENSVVDFGGRIGRTLTTNGRSLVVSNLAWGFSNVLVLALTLRFSGITLGEMSPSVIVLATGLLMAINILPIPGKDALVTTALVSMLGLTTNAEVNDFGAALLLYRVVTWILPMPVGGVAYFAWRSRVRRDRVTSVGDDPGEAG